MATYCWDGESTAVKVNRAQKTYGVGEFFRERGGNWRTLLYSEKEYE